MPDWYHDFAMPALLGVMALFFLAIGLRGLLKRRPFVISARWQLAVILIGFLPQLLSPIQSFHRVVDAPMSSRILVWTFPIIFGVLAAFLAVLMRGYIAFGVTDDSMRQGLLAALAQLQLPHEETLGVLRLPTVPVDLKVSVPGWVGTGQFKASTRDAGPLVVQIARAMNRYFRNTAVTMNLTIFVAYIVFGLLFGAIDVALFLMP